VTGGKERHPGYELEHTPTGPSSR